MFDNAFTSEALTEALDILKNDFPLAIWETIYVTLLSTLFAIIIGLPLGVLLVAGEKGGVLPLPKALMKVLNVIINLLRSVPFLILMIVVFPLLGRAMGLSDAAFGLWAGTAVNDTSSVVATGYAFSEAAGDFATMVKLTRTLAIIPAVLVFAAIQIHFKKKAQSNAPGVKVRLSKIFPWFILGFLAMSALTSLGLIPAAAASVLKTVSKFLMVAALAAIGLNTDFRSLCRSGARPMLHGFIVSALVVLVAIGVEYGIGIAPNGTLL